jgi:hypothetical protein
MTTGGTALPPVMATAARATGSQVPPAREPEAVTGGSPLPLACRGTKRARPEAHFRTGGSQVPIGRNLTAAKEVREDIRKTSFFRTALRAAGNGQPSPLELDDPAPPSTPVVQSKKDFTTDQASDTARAGRHQR